MDSRGDRQLRGLARVIAAASIFLLVGTFIYAQILHIRYPEIRLAGTELYGDHDEHLKDLEWRGDLLYSTSGDPWISYSLDEPVPVRLIEIDQSSISTDDCTGMIFDTTAWTIHSYDVKNGRTIVYYEQVESIQDFRFDLVATQEVTLAVDAIVINSYYGMVMIALWQVSLVTVYIMSLAYCVHAARSMPIVQRRDRWRFLCWTQIAAISAATVMTFYAIHTLEDISRMACISIALIALLGMAACAVSGSTLPRIIRLLGILQYVVLHVGLIEFLSGAPYNYEDYQNGILNLYLLSIVLACVYILLGRMRLAMVLVSGIVGLLALVNHYYAALRRDPFELVDLLMSATAADVIGNYEIVPDTQVWVYIVFEIAFLCVILNHVPDKRTSKGRVIALLYSAIGICWGAGYAPSVSYWNMQAVTEDLGYLNSLLAYARQDLVIERPQGYSSDQVEQILDDYESRDETSSADQPDIIVIMNESFSDLPDVYGFETNMDVMPYIHSLEENTVKGDLLVSVFGGSTADTEWEFLTGCSMAFMSRNANPYVQYVKRSQESLASELADLGYTTIAFHPESATNYSRNIVYPYLGFDQFISIADDLAYTDRLHSYVSDSADIRDVIDIDQQNAGDQPLFVFNVTMQNHGGYSRDESNVDVTVYPTDEDLRYVQLEEYLSLIRESDAAFEELTTYYENQDHKVIILMFGDHQPGLDTEILNALQNYDQSNDELAGSNGMESYIVPFILWANYDIEEEEDVLISPGYLRALLLDKAGATLGTYDRFLLDCYEQYPAVNYAGYYDRDRQWHSIDQIQNDSLLHDYALLQYGKVFDHRMDLSLY